MNYKKLNENTIQSFYPIPNMEELTDSIGEASVFTGLDLEAGYHQIGIREEDKFKTGFITREGAFEFNRMPFGLINAPFTFQKIMNKIFKDILYRYVLVYLDDILIFSKNEKQHLIHLE